MARRPRVEIEGGLYHGKNKRIITAKEVFILFGKESGATITEMSGIVGLDQSNAGRRFDAARQKCKTDP